MSSGFALFISVESFVEQNVAPKVQRNKDIDLGGYKLHVLDLIGEGGFAKVFKCIDDDQEVVALKVYFPFVLKLFQRCLVWSSSMRMGSLYLWSNSQEVAARKAIWNHQ